jgi:hypothetical protein
MLWPQLLSTCLLTDLCINEHLIISYYEIHWKETINNKCHSWMKGRCISILQNKFQVFKSSDYIIPQKYEFQKLLNKTLNEAKSLVPMLPIPMLQN